jgi:hypothetical protein
MEVLNGQPWCKSNDRWSRSSRRTRRVHGVVPAYCGTHWWSIDYRMVVFAYMGNRYGQGLEKTQCLALARNNIILWKQLLITKLLQRR